MIDESLNVLMSHKQRLEEEIKALLTQVAGLRKKTEALDAAFHILRDGDSSSLQCEGLRTPQSKPSKGVLESVTEALATAPDGEGYTTRALATMLYPYATNQESIKSQIRKAISILLQEGKVRRTDGAGPGVFAWVPSVEVDK